METSPGGRVLEAVLAVHHELAAMDRRAASTLGLSEADHACLELIHRAGPITPSELGRRLDTAPATMTGRLARLEQGGWVTRSVDNQDRRSVTLSLSAEREHAMKRVFGPIKDTIIALVDQRGDAIADTIELLDVVRQAVRDHCRETDPAR